MANQIDIECPYCKGEITIDPEWIGQEGQCPYCNQEFVLSEPESHQNELSYDDPVQSDSDERITTTLKRDKVAGRNSFHGNLGMRKLLLFGIAGVSLIVSLIVLGFVFGGGSKDSGSINDCGHKGVQLWKDGPYWAETNIGAENPWDSGYYFWWGDTAGYSPTGGTFNFSFDTFNCPTSRKSTAQLQSEGWIVFKDGGYVLSPAHDAAHVCWGGKWVMPTTYDFYGLKIKCDWTKKKMMGVIGYVVRGRGEYASASIFIPCVSHGEGTFLCNDGTDGEYWSSVPSRSFYRSFYLEGVSVLKINSVSDSHFTSDASRGYGRPIRPVLRSK